MRPALPVAVALGIVVGLGGYALWRESPSDPSSPRVASAAPDSLQTAALASASAASLPASVSPRAVAAVPPVTPFTARTPDGWATFQRALASQDPAAIYAGILAGRSCLGFQDSDLSGIESEARKYDRTDPATPRRIEAAQALQRLCGGFAYQQGVVDGIERLWAQLDAHRASPAAARQLGDELWKSETLPPSASGRLCDALARDPVVVLREAEAGIAKHLRPPNGLSEPRSGLVTQAAVNLSYCTLSQSCADDVYALVNCTHGGACGEFDKKMRYPSLSPVERDAAQRLSERLIVAVGAPACGALFVGR